MNAEQRYELLIEYAEGTLPAERRAEVEQMLLHSPEMQNDLESLDLAFDSLQVERQPSVPDQYFSNFVAVLQRNIASGERRSFRSVPQFILRFIRPAAAFSVAASLILLFRALGPASPESTIYSLVKDVDQSEIVTLIEETSTFTEQTTEHLLGSKLHRESFGIDPSNYQSESEMLALLDDDEAELVVEQLQQRR
jgi:anti-sigma-K factor RskA